MIPDYKELLVEESTSDNLKEKLKSIDKHKEKDNYIYIYIIEVLSSIKRDIINLITIYNECDIQIKILKQRYIDIDAKANSMLSILSRPIKPQSMVDRWYD